MERGQVVPLHEECINLFIVIDNLGNFLWTAPHQKQLQLKYNFFWQNIHFPKHKKGYRVQLYNHHLFLYIYPLVIYITTFKLIWFVYINPFFLLLVKTRSMLREGTYWWNDYFLSVWSWNRSCKRIIQINLSIFSEHSVLNDFMTLEKIIFYNMVPKGKI